MINGGSPSVLQTIVILAVLEKKNKVSEFDGEPETKLSPMNIMSPFGFKSEKIWLRTGLIKKGNHGFSGN